MAHLHQMIVELIVDNEDLTRRNPNGNVVVVVIRDDVRLIGGGVT